MLVLSSSLHYRCTMYILNLQPPVLYKCTLYILIQYSVLSISSSITLNYFGQHSQKNPKQEELVLLKALLRWDEAHVFLIFNSWIYMKYDSKKDDDDQLFL